MRFYICVLRMDILVRSFDVWVVGGVFSFVTSLKDLGEERLVGGLVGCDPIILGFCSSKLFLDAIEILKSRC